MFGLSREGEGVEVGLGLSEGNVGLYKRNSGLGHTACHRSLLTRGVHNRIRDFSSTRLCGYPYLRGT